jgi:hypothetical protein
MKAVGFRFEIIPAGLEGTGAAAAAQTLILAGATFTLEVGKVPELAE